MHPQQLMILVISESKQVRSGLIPTTAGTKWSLGTGRRLTSKPADTKLAVVEPVLRIQANPRSG